MPCSWDVTSLLGLSMGINEKTLGIEINQLDISGVTAFFDSGEENVKQ